MVGFLCVTWEEREGKGVGVGGVRARVHGVLHADEVACRWQSHEVMTPIRIMMSETSERQARHLRKVSRVVADNT